MALGAKQVKSVGDYDLVEQIAEGGMGTVFKARSRLTGNIVAIKVVPPHLANNQTLLKRFENEFRAASKLNHPNVVRALEFGSEAGRPFLVMEFVDGESLGQRLERDGKISEDDSIRIISAAAEGLDQAHKAGLIHRDVKPDNIMVTHDGQVKLADLGLVKELEADLNLTHTGRGLGTPHFMAPEQFRNAKNADVRCDIYSLGATLYMMVTGELPFKSCSPLDAWMKKMQNDISPARQVNAALSSRTDIIIQRCMHPEAAKRPGSCQEFIGLLNGQAVKAEEVPISKPSAASPTDLWYLVYKDETGATHTVKGTTEAIRRSLQSGLLGDASNIRISRTKAGTFEPLRDHPNFRDLIADANQTDMSPHTPTPVQIPPVPRPGSGDSFTSKKNASRTPASASTPTPIGPTIKLPNRPQDSSEMIKFVMLAVVAMAVGMLFFFLFNR